jgi:hypothetical protein
MIRDKMWRACCLHRGSSVPACKGLLDRQGTQVAAGRRSTQCLQCAVHRNHRYGSKRVCIVLCEPQAAARASWQHANTQALPLRLPLLSSCRCGIIRRCIGASPRRTGVLGIHRAHASSTGRQLAMEGAGGAPPEAEERLQEEERQLPPWIMPAPMQNSMEFWDR